MKGSAKAPTKRLTTSRPASQNGPKRKASSPSMFTLPEPAAFKAIAKELRFSAEQTNNLQLAVRQAHADLECHEKTLSARPPRADLVRRIQRLDKAFSDLNDECKRQARYFEHILPIELRAESGRMLNFSSIERAAGADVVPRPIQRSIRESVEKGELTTIQEIEQASAMTREMLGLKHPSVLLPDLIERLHRPLREWVAFNRLNAGGRPEDLTRNYLIARLADSAPEIIGRKAAASQTGPFVRLCAAVLDACGLDVSGLDKAIPRVLQKTRKPARTK